MKKRVANWLLALVLLIQLLPGTAQAVREDGEETDAPHAVTVTLSAQRGTDFLAREEQLTVPYGMAANYWYGLKPAAEGEITVLDALVAAHRKLYGEAFTAETAEDYLSISHGSPQAMFGNGETALYSGFAVNHAYPMDEDGMGYTAATAPLADGDVVEFFYYEDANWRDYLTWFADGTGQPLDTVGVEAGQPLTLYLRGFIYMNGYASPRPEPVYNSENMLSAYTVDEDGQLENWLCDITEDTGAAAMTFDAPGTYQVTAMGYTEDGSRIVMPFCKVVVAEEGAEAAIKLEAEGLSPAFSPEITAYTMPDQACEKGSVALTVTAPEGYAISASVNGEDAVPMTSGVGAGLALRAGTNQITCTLASGTEETAYTVTVKRAVALASLTGKTEDGKTVAVSKAGENTYAASAAIGSFLVLTPAAAGDKDNTVVTVNGQPLAERYAVREGENTFHIHLESRDGTVSEEYTLTVTGAAAESGLPRYEAQWKNFRNSDDNLAVTTAKTPRTAEETALRWRSSESLNDGWNYVSPLLMVDGDLFCTAGTTIYRIDSETGAVVARGTMADADGAWGNAPLAYGNGMVFVPLGNGRVQAFSAGDLTSLWVSESLGSQCTTALIYRDGYVYGSTGNAAPAQFFCLTAEDEDLAAEDETKTALWTAYEADFPSGSYWATPLVTENAVIYGTDANSGGTAALFSRDRRTGGLLDRVDLEGLGSVRSSLVRSGDTLYFTTNGGDLCSVKLAEDGTLSGLACVRHENTGYSTSSPVIYDGVVYYGAQGCLVAADAGTLAELRRVAFPDSGAGVQSSPLLTTAYAEEGTVYLYVTQNTTPGTMYVVKDDGETLGLSALYTPEESDWCTASAICDGDGTIYYHNDSGYLYALERTETARQRCRVTFAVEPSGAEVTVAGCTAESDGSFLLGSGTYAYTARCEGYQTASGTLTVTEEELGTDRTVTVSLVREQGGGTVSRIQVSVQVKTHDGEACGGGYTYQSNEKDYTTLVARTVTVPEGTTASEALTAVLDAAGVEYTIRSGYVSQIGGLAEFDHSSRSGWMYMVDGVLPEVGAGQYQLRDNCEVVWFYTDDYTKEEDGADYDGSGGSADKPQNTEMAAAVFADVPAELWCHDAVMAAVERGWFQGTGDGRFDPDAPMTRGMLVTVLYRMAGSPAVETAAEFADVAADRYCAAAVAWAAERGFVEGYDDGTFRPDAPMSRQQMAAVLARYGESKGLDTGKKASLDSFADADRVGVWALPAMEWAVAEGVFRGGTDGALHPEGTLTRAHSAALLVRLEDKLA